MAVHICPSCGNSSITSEHLEGPFCALSFSSTSSTRPSRVQLLVLPPAALLLSGRSQLREVPLCRFHFSNQKVDKGCSKV